MTSMATKYSPLSFTIFSSLLLILLATTSSSAQAIKAAHGFSSIKEATVKDIQLAFKQNQLTSRKLVELYLKQISRLNPVLKGVLEVNPDALYQADKADHERKFKAHGSLSPLHGIPILLKDNIATKDKLNTTAGSYALLGSVVQRDAGVVTKLRKAGAIILGKATLSEWSQYRSNAVPSGWNARKGQGKSPYTMGDPCGSSSGSAISVAANMAAVSLGTETDGSILCPSSNNLVVGIKPTVGLTSRAGVIPISPRQDSVGPICRTVADAVYVLDAIVGIDHYDNATIETSQYIPKGGYAQFLKTNGLRAKRVGIVRDFYNIGNDTIATQIELVVSPVRSLADLIAFNKENSKLERLDYGQDLFIKAESTNGIGNAEKAALLNLAKLTREGFVKLMTKNKLDAIVTPGNIVSRVLAIGGFPGVIVPAGYGSDRKPFGLCFGGLKGSEPKLIEIAYGFEQATKIRKPPKLTT
ncbi:putative amidase [Quercus suber]|uniref:Amidase n=1 Tax=Quercus suber TaxID=58331 RepID=A0AAW0MAD0_QUESU